MYFKMKFILIMFLSIFQYLAEKKQSHAKDVQEEKIILLFTVQKFTEDEQVEWKIIDINEQYLQEGDYHNEII